MTGSPAGGRKNRNTPIRRRLSLHSSRFNRLALIIALPLLALVGFFGYQFLVRAGDILRSSRPTPHAATPAPEARGSPGNVPSAGGSGPKIVLILDDVGFASPQLEAASRLDARINFAVIPGSPHAAHASDLLSARGHEILCHLPMEPLGYPAVSPGDGAILTSMSNDEIRRAALAGFRSIPHARGINNHMGSRATGDARVMREVLEATRELDAFFVDSRTTGRSVAGKLAREMEVPTISRDVFLDDTNDEQSIRRQLAELGELSRRRGIAVGIGHLYPDTIRVLTEEIPRLKQKGFRFVFASEAVR